MATKRRSKTEQPHASEVSRRRFLQSVIAASAATGAAAAMPAAAGPAAVATKSVVGAEATSALQVLSEAQAGLLRGVMNRLIPAQGSMPAAGEIGLATYVDGVLADATHLRQPLLDILGEVAVAHKDEGQSPEELDAVLVRLERTHPEAFASLVETVYTGYYSHPQVLDAIGWVHPGSEPDTSETLDTRLLEDVVRRGPIYRHV